MAKVKYGEMISDIRGKINGTVHAKNRSGAYMRNKTTPVNPQSTSQSGVRNSFATFSQGWRSLTVSQRAGWIAAVDSFTRSNIFGDTFKLTGSNLYMSLNKNIAQIGGTAITTPPLPSAVTPVSSSSFVADVSSANIILTYAPAIPAAQTVQIWATEPVSAGVSFVKNRYRYLGKIVTADTSPYDMTAIYEAKFGTGWKVAGQKLFVRMVPLITASGIIAPGLDASNIVQA